jgi:hypothetical protein
MKKLIAVVLTVITLSAHAVKTNSESSEEPTKTVIRQRSQSLSLPFFAPLDFLHSERSSVNLPDATSPTSMGYAEGGGLNGP